VTTTHIIYAQGERVVLVREETSPEDVGGLHAAEVGGQISHTQVVSRAELRGVRLLPRPLPLETGTCL
jgi:phosphoenolpyruvate synthase/pyruvate phosphate dikinase